MNAGKVTPLFFLLASCSSGNDEGLMPTDADVARVEGRLAGHPCIGDLNNWERNYRYSTVTGLFTPHSLNPDLDIVEFHLRRAGTLTISPGRKILASKSADWPDSEDVQTVKGEFKLKGDRLDVRTCERVARQSG